MKEKIILISIDGLRPDGLLACGNPFVEQMRKEAYYTLDAQSVMPSVTLPCHMSMFHSVPPQRHGITTNIYIPMARPLNGLFEQLKAAGKVNAMFYGWERLRDIGTPSSLTYAVFSSSRAVDRTDVTLTDYALARIEESEPDFVFLYLVDTDERGGHDNGWMTEAYLQRVSLAIDQVKRVMEACADRYTVIVTADHGGHDRDHGSDIPEDMTIPIFCFGRGFEAGKQFSGGSILDIAPTIAARMGVAPAPEWEGKSLV